MKLADVLKALKSGNLDIDKVKKITDLEEENIRLMEIFAKLNAKRMELEEVKRMVELKGSGF